MILKLIVRNIIGNRRKAISCIAGICLSVMLIFVTINTYVSFQQMRIENAYDSYGQYNIILHEANKEASEWVKGSFGENAKIGIEEIAGVTDSGITLIAGDSNSIEMNRYKFVEGELPSQDNETAISATAKLDGEYIINRYKTGDSILMNGSEYIISGIIDDYDYSTTDTYKTALIKNEPDTDIFNIYMYFKNKQDYLQAVKEIKSHLTLEEGSILEGRRNDGFIGGYKLIINVDLNMVCLEGEGGLQDTNIGQMLLLFIIILALTSIILEIHIFAAYLNDRGRQQGILINLGFSDSYISGIYFAECMLLVVAGCFIGIILGRFATVFFFELIQDMRTTRLVNFEPQFTVRSYILAGAISLAAFIIGLIPIIARSMRMGINDMLKTKRTYMHSANRKKNFKSRHITVKYFLQDNRFFEKSCIYASMTVIGLGLTLLIYVNKYVDYTIRNREVHDSQFELLSDDISGMDNFESLIPEAVYYDLVYNATGGFYIDSDIINENYADVLKDDGLVYCGIVGVSELQYKNKIEISSEMSYEDFVKSGGAIVIDNYMSTGDRILKELPVSIKYPEKNEGAGACYKAGEINIICRSEYKNWNDQMGIAIVVPIELYKEKFDYTNVLFKINVEKGSELEVAERLNKYAYLYKYTFLDNTSEYIKEHDDIMTVRMYAYGIFAFVTLMNLFIIIYVNILVYVRRRRNISILKALGHSDIKLISSMIFGVIIQSVVSAIVSVFISTVFVKRLLPPATQNIVLMNGGKNILYVLVFMLITQVISIIIIFLRIRRHRIIYDLRL